MDESDAADAMLSEATLDRMVRAVRPAWSLREATPAAEGTDAVYFLAVETPAGPRECVLKACEFLDPAEFRPEPHLLSLVESRTSIPVPSVAGAVDRHSELPAPFFLIERLDGEVRENEAGDLPVETVERLAREAGQHLGELHRLGDFEAFGPIRLASDADREPAGGVAVGDRRLAVGDAGRESWRAQVEALADGALDGVEERFADCAGDLRAFADARLDALDRSFAPVLGHDDYRLGNLLVDADSGRTRAVLDWGNAHTLEPQYNLVLAEQYLAGWATHDDPRRERVRAALREGYGRTTGGVDGGAASPLERDGDAQRRRDLYLAVTRLFPLAWFSLWYGDQSDAERERTAARHRRAARQLLG
ncbi:phosphotransferase family protein [Halorussus halobius]|uniref:phosphotransferase family protein n=1 Tax=Halorussus halobius TaxID=1710537 RepID=UPI001093291A|nr:phosphotransferase [Halorussus halobius]